MTKQLSLTFKHLLLLICVWAITPGTAIAIGIFLPRQPNVAAPIMKSASVDTVITNNLARTRITQIFHNPNPRIIEADFYFAIPNGADLTDFVLYMNGKPVKGEVLGKDEAQNTYRDIVRKLKDPGLVEWADKNLLRVRIFPIPANGEQKMELELTQLLTADQGYYRYYLPMNSAEKAHVTQPAPEVKYTLRIEGTQPIRNVYSPTHKIDTVSSDPKVMLITAKDETGDKTKDFMVYYESSEEDIALSLLTNKTAGNDGYFSLRISPPWDEKTSAPQHGDYVFVMDSSGSMTGEKIEQARKSLRYCINLLKAGDRFNVIRFSTSVEPWAIGLKSASEDQKRAATQWTDELQARGGTNISGALKMALDLKDTASSSTTEKRIFTVVFITDGLPTVGETSVDSILKSAAADKADDVRVFTFGVGNDVNTRLLDTLAEQTRAASDYVSPGADLEVPVSRFFDKVSQPALFNLKLDIPTAQITEMYPAQLPDLFYGTELVVIGRYKNSGSSPIILKGKMGNDEKTYTFEKNFPKNDPNNQFLEKLWATRKVAYLLDQIRKSGESSELRKEVEELARKYSLVTPYTSYLAMEDQEAQSSSQRAAAQPIGRPIRFYVESKRSSTAGAGALQSRSAAPASESLYMKAESGADAVNLSKDLSQMKSADKIAPSTDISKRAAGKTFTLTDGVWQDTELTNPQATEIKIQYLSDAWFQLSEKFPQLKEIFSIGDKIRIQLKNGKTLVVAAEGIDSLTVSDFESIGQPL